MVTEHDLKTHPEPFKAVKWGEKTGEIRLDDRYYEVKDILHLHEWDPATEEYTGDPVRDLEVTHVQRGYGLQDGYVMLSFRPIS